MTDQFTPGPWKIRDTFGSKYIEDKTNNNLIATLDWMYSQDETNANAALIAAAPELLKALEKIISIYGLSNIDADTDEMNLARAVIAKAKGEK